MSEDANSGGNEVISTIVPYKNPCALVGYLAVFSVLGFIPILGIIGTIMGMAAFVLGLLGLQAASYNPLAKGKVHAWIGILAGGFFALSTGAWNAYLIILMSKGY